MRVERVIPVLIVLAGIGMFIALVQMNLNKTQAKVAIIAGVLVFMALCWGTITFFDHKRRKELGAALELAGLMVGPPSEARFIHDLERGQRELTGKFWAHGKDHIGPLEVAEFSYATGSGKHKQTHRNMQVIRPCPDRWPRMRLSRKPGLLTRSLRNLSGGQDFGLENEAFGKRWRIECDDRDFVLLLLSPIVQDWLMLAPKDESWIIADGRIAVTRKRRCYREDVQGMTARLDEFLAMMPRELVAYERLAS